MSRTNAQHIDCFVSATTFVPNAEIETEDNLDIENLVDRDEYERLKQEELTLPDVIIPFGTRLQASMKAEDDRLKHSQRIRQLKFLVRITDHSYESEITKFIRTKKESAENTWFEYLMIRTES